MTLTQQYGESITPDLLARVGMATAKIAQDISSEPPDTEYHAVRASLANQVARSPSMFQAAFTTMVCAQGLTRDSSDQEIINMVSAVWNTMAGATTATVTPI